MTSHPSSLAVTRPSGERGRTALRRTLTLFGLSALIVAIGVMASAAQAGTAKGQGRSTAASATSASSNVVTDWNSTLVNALLVAHTPPQPGTRIGAIVQTSVFDAVNGIKGRYTQFHPELLTTDAPRGASAPAAAAGAAYTALVALFPAQKPTFDAQLAATLATLSDDDEDAGTSPPVTRGLAWGTTVANAILAWRSTDGFTATLPAYIIQPLPSWQPTPPAFAPPAWRQFAAMTPWAIASPGQFLPALPPAVTSARYAQDFNEVKAIGNAATSPPDLVATARFWNAQGGFDTVATIWNRTAEPLVAGGHVSLVDNARFFALLNSSMADAVIAVWNAKNTYDTWRPITAIRNANIDGNDATLVDPGWTPVIVTPAFQEYPSGHSGVSTAAATVLASFFGNDTTFTVSSDGAPGLPRTYSSFSAVLDEIALARIAGGIHFRFACDAAQQMGESVAEYAMSTEFLPLHANR
jgi:membrane-associated phospholipid phosphatase